MQFSKSEQVTRKAGRPQSARAQAPGKIILSGEHFVVLGAPAVAMAINLHSQALVKPTNYSGVRINVDIPLRFIGYTKTHPAIPDTRRLLKPLRLAAQVTLDHIARNPSGLDVGVNCDIPVASGLGSSASTAVSIIAGVGKSQRIELSRNDIYKLAFASENFLHGKPSGVDQATCIYGGMIQFTRPSHVRQLRLKRSPMILACDTGIHHVTGALVRGVVRRSRRERVDFKDHLADVQKISEGIVTALKNGDDKDVGLLMLENHELLRMIGVSHPMLDRLVKIAKSAGALGAKLTGAGGGGCIVVVCETARSQDTIMRSLRREGGIPYKVSLEPRGVESFPVGDSAQIG